MRILATCSMGGMGHLLPVLTAVKAYERLGHTVHLLVPPSLSAEAERSGAAVTAGSEPDAQFIEEIWHAALDANAPSGFIDTELFAKHAARAMLPHARKLCDAVKPNVILREPCEYAAAVAAFERGIPQAQIGISQAHIEWKVLGTVAPVLEGYANGIARTIRAQPYLTSFPEPLDSSPWPDTRRYRLDDGDEGAAGRTFEKVATGWESPLVYVTFGTVFGHVPGARAVYRSVLDLLGKLPYQFIMTVGSHIAIEHLAPVPENVHAYQWIPQSAVFPHVRAVLCHGGSGTTWGALAAGIPVGVWPFFADQEANGRLVAKAGAGIMKRGNGASNAGMKPFDARDLGELRSMINQLGEDARFGSAALRIREAMGEQKPLHTVLAGLLCP